MDNVFVMTGLSSTTKIFFRFMSFTGSNGINSSCLEQNSGQQRKKEYHERENGTIASLWMKFSRFTAPFLSILSADSAMTNQFYTPGEQRSAKVGELFA